MTIGRDRITNSASDRIEDVLADVAGLASFRRSDSRSANPTSQGVTLRGIGGNAASRALFVLDGVPQADPFAGWIAFPAYAPGRLGRVRVVRGGGSAVWGPGAETGTIELESATPDELAPLEARLAYGSRNALDASAEALLRRDGGFATASATYQRGDGFTPIRAADRGPIDRPAPYEQASGAIRGVIEIGPATELQANLLAFTDRRDRGTPFSAIKSDGTDASVRLVSTGHWRWSALAYVQARDFASQFNSINDARTTATLTLDQYAVPATGLGARFEIEPPLGGGVTLRLGGDARRVSGATHELATYVNASPTRRREAGGASTTAGAFADLAFKLGPVELDANGRVDHWTISGGHLQETVIASGAFATNDAYADRAGWEPTGRLGLGWRASPLLTLRAAAYRGWRLPTLNELYRPFRAGADATAANPALKPEHLDGAEIGADLRLGHATTLAVTAFDNRLSDAIGNITLARGPFVCPGAGTVSAAGFCRQRGNLDAIRARGAEIEGSTRVGAFTARLSYAYTRSRVRGSGPAAGLDGLVPAQTPTHDLSGTIGWSHREASASLTARYVSSQFEDDQNSRSLASAFTIDGSASVPILPRLALEGRVENLFDASVETGYSGAAIERSHPQSFWIGLRARL